MCSSIADWFDAKLSTKTASQPRDVAACRWRSNRQLSGLSIACSCILTRAQSTHTTSERLLLRKHFISLSNYIGFYCYCFDQLSHRSTRHRWSVWDLIRLLHLSTFVLQRDCVFLSFLNVFITFDEQTRMSVDDVPCFSKSNVSNSDRRTGNGAKLRRPPLFRSQLSLHRHRCIYIEYHRIQHWLIGEQWTW